MQYVLVRNSVPTAVSTTAKALLKELPRGAYTTARTVGATSVLMLDAHVARLANSVKLMTEAAGTSLRRGDVLMDASALRPIVAREIGIGLGQMHKLWAAEADVGDEPARHGASAGATARDARVTVLLTWDGDAAAGGDDDAAVARRRAKGGDSDGGEAALAVSVSGAGGDARLDDESGGASDAGFDIFTHVAPLPPRREPPIRLVARRKGRINAVAKDSAWVQ